MHKSACPGARVILSCLLVLCALIADDCVAGSNPVGSPLLERLPQNWRDDLGRDTTLADFRGRRVYLTMAYATCRSICPMTMAHLKKLQAELDARGEAAEFVVVGYDPTLDDPPAWRQYRSSRGLLRENWHFLTGTVATTGELARSLGFGFWKYDRHVMHGYRIVMLDEHGELAEEYGPAP